MSAGGYGPPPAGAYREPFGVGTLLGQTFSVYFANFVPFTLIAFIALLPATVVTFLAPEGPPGRPGPEQVAAQLLATLLNLVLGPIATGGVTYGVVQHVRGRHASIGDCIGVGLSRVLPVIGVAICQGLLTFVGALLCLFPAFIFMTMYYAAVPAAVIENPGVIGALKRSAALTSGYRWQIFGIVLVLGIVYVIILAIMGAGVGIAMAATGVKWTSTVENLFGAVAGWISAGLLGTAGALVYYNLRIEKEGVDADQIASVFE